MRITSVTIRNCRVHREIKVDFDPSRTLIGGPNESGKSTLIEALHRALFLKAKGNTEQHRALVSSLYSGHPEVDLTFESGGNSYLLKKRFGAAGTTTLAPSNSVLLSGDAAEGELARVLNVLPGSTSKTITIQWAHLWVWQGCAGDDPSEQATVQQNALLQRLQQMGGAAALQSELDARVAKHFSESKDQIYTQVGKPKAGSELDQADSNLSAANEQLALAAERVRKLDASATDLESASRSFLTADTSLTDLQRQQEELESKVRELGELRQKEATQFHAAKEADARHCALGSANEQIVSARVEISRLEESLKPQTEAIARLETTAEEAKSSAAAAEQAYRTATEAVRAARICHDFASAYIQLFEKTEAYDTLFEKDKKVSKRRGELSDLEEQLARLSKVNKAKLQKLHDLESECSNARASLQAMATGFEIVAADKPVKAGSRLIKIGEKQILTEDTDVSIGSSVRLRIQPGGGTTLAEARQCESDAQKSLQEVLDSLGLPSVKDAEDVFARRDELGSHIKTAQAELKGMGAENLPDELQSALNELTTAKANVERLALLAPDEKAPGDKAAAKASVKASEKKLSYAEDQETEAKANRDHASEAMESAAKTLKLKRSKSEEQEKRLTGSKAQLDLLINTHGDDTKRSQALIESESAKVAAKNLLKGTANAIAALQPDLLDGDRSRIMRSIKVRTDERNDARTRIALAQAALRSDGSEDPQAALATAEAKARSVIEYRNSVHRKAQALVLLDKLFQEEQRNLSEQFTQPFAEKISGYLQCIFGAGARAHVALESNEFSGLRLFRPGFGGAPFAFDTLSGGAKEQTAAAVRLAMAEVLAADHSECLPVVFDDAFAYSDPERVKQLQRMLDLAAVRGLQVIVLTCNPVDYASLGAKTISIHSER